MTYSNESEVDKLIAYLKEQQKSDKETIRRLQESNAALQKTIQFLTEQTSLNAAALNATIRQMQQTIDGLNQKIAQLEEKLHKNSKNSSKPPSSMDTVNRLLPRVSVKRPERREQRKAIKVPAFP